MSEVVNEVQKVDKRAIWLKIIKYVVVFLLGAAVSVAILVYKDFWNEESLLVRYKLLSDAFTVPAVLLICLGALVWISNHEGFVGLGFLANYALRAIVPGMGLKKDETYADYRERVTSREKKKGYAVLFIVGGVFAILTAIFMILFYSIYPG